MIFNHIALSILDRAVLKDKIKEYYNLYGNQFNDSNKHLVPKDMRTKLGFVSWNGQTLRLWEYKLLKDYALIDDHAIVCNYPYLKITDKDGSYSLADLDGDQSKIENKISEINTANTSRKASIHWWTLYGRYQNIVSELQMADNAERRRLKQLSAEVPC
jgi:hypothetical protein